MQKLSNNPRDVALLSLTHMVRLLSAELVAGSHRDDIRRLEQAMRDKVAQIDTTAFTEEATAAGLAEARSLIEQVLVHVRAQADRAAKRMQPTSQDGRREVATLH